ncbi:anthranilate synthase component I family protein [Agromyces soli]
MPRRIRSLTLPGWCDPERVFLSVAAGAPRLAWLDGGSDATEGRSVIAVAAPGAPAVVAGDDADPDEVYGALRAGIEAEPGDTDADTDTDTDDEPNDAAAGRSGARAAVGWHGWFAYEFGARTLGLPAEASDAPVAAFFFADRVIVFEHGPRLVRLEWLEPGRGDGAALQRWIDEMREAVAAAASAGAEAERAGRTTADAGAAEASAPAPAPTAKWRHDAAAYRAMIADCQAAIVRGDAYQLCLTNRIDVDARPDPVSTYLRLRRSSPSHHGGFLRFDDTALLSASPEQFLLVERDGTVATKPMKGTRPRSSDAVADLALRAELSASEKERAENLMIVDLMRNDLGRIAQLGSVRVPSLLEVEQYPHVHQLVSTVNARLRPGLTALDAVRSAFPAGSMTGAPKESAMRILHRLEGGPRGVYSGAFGCLGADGSADLAMVIRSIVITPAGASIGTGGGITALSVPDEEVEETRIKARALVSALGAAAAPY